MTQPRFTTERWTLAALLLFTLLVRGSVLWLMRDNLQQDPDAYREIGEFLVQRGEFALGKLSRFESASQPRRTAYRPPLYPVILSNLPTADREGISLPKVAVLHLLFGVSTVWLTWVTARKMGVTDHVKTVGIVHPAIAALLVACDPILLNQQSQVMTETLATFLAILSLWCLAWFDDDRSWFTASLAGGAMGLAALCRPNFLPWLAVAAVAMLLVRAAPELRASAPIRLPRFGWRLANIAGLVVGAATIMSPWVIRNYQLFRKPIITTTHGGYTLLLGNNDEFYRWLEAGPRDLPWASQSLDYRLWQRRNAIAFQPDAELRFDDLCYQLATKTIRNQPVLFLRACVYRIGQLWSPLPHKLTKDESTGRRLLRYVTCVWYCGVYAMAAIGIWRMRWRVLRSPWIWGMLLCLTFTAVHTFYWTNLRMRAPLMPFVAILAAAAFTLARSASEGKRRSLQ